jgi:hypothetical protein
MIRRKMIALAAALVVSALIGADAQARSGALVLMWAAVALAATLSPDAGHPPSMIRRWLCHLRRPRRGLITDLHRAFNRP